ncbi:uncharacterized protein LOC110983575 [Acanthaster planci]|uniref:Uncharacterized protein LOC110983575 n=1 Tax=Acanthaster planci TaxID=133434 RepID=A0A8B7Z0Y2_ACAPL|nr:uncharacterized protein LOC110983575 [Acanthaster planci]
MSAIIAAVCFTVTAALYTYIIAKIHNRAVQLPNRPKQTSKVLRMVIINTVIFFSLNSSGIALAISFIVIVKNNFIEPSQDSECLKLVAAANILTVFKVLLQLINNSIDPLVYSATNSDYRTAVVQAFSFLKLCSTCYPRQNPSQPSEPREQIELHVIPQPQNDQQHHAVRPSSSSKPPSQGLAQHTQSQQPLHSCQQQCSRPSSSKASMHSQQHVLVYAHVHAEPAGIPALASSHQEQCSSQTDCKPSMQGEQCVHPELEKQPAVTSKYSGTMSCVDHTQLSAQGEQCVHPEPEWSQSLESCQEQCSLAIGKNK